MNTNYVNFSKEDVEPVATETTAEFLDVVNEIEAEKLEEEVVEEEKVEEDGDTNMGVVTCGKLYLRSKPSKDSDWITILEKDEEIMIISEDDSEWYKVYTAAGQEGFCKKEFIKID